MFCTTVKLSIDAAPQYNVLILNLHVRIIRCVQLMEPLNMFISIFTNFHDSRCKARSRPPPQKGTTRNV